jgi:hypothetical protein
VAGEDWEDSGGGGLMQSHVLCGSCLCGAVTYEITAALNLIENCHCRTCRKAHGAAFSTNTAVPTNALKIQGEENLTQYVSSANRVKCFCSKCGSQLFIRRTNAPEITVITLGTLDDDPQVQPSRHVFFDSRAPWFDLDARLPVYRKYPGFEPKDE